MIEGARQLPVHHLTIRVPWHDNGWAGTFCSNPCGNTSCTIFKRIAQNRDDDYETAMAGKSLEGLADDRLPPCVDEHGMFMAPFALPLIKRHPYAEIAKTTHGHFAPTPYVIPPHSAAVVPFRWMLRQEVEGDEKYNVASKADQLQIDYRQEREPDLRVNEGWRADKKTWVQEGTNQRILLDTFFSALKPQESLVFFYAKRTPLVEDPRRVIVGVGRVMSVAGATEYHYVGGRQPPGKMSGYLWERSVEHSIRPGQMNGFLLPYQQLLALAEKNSDIDLSVCTAFAPLEYYEQYSYAGELLPHDGAIASLLALEHAIAGMRDWLDAPWAEYLTWIDCELNRLWQVRGAFPGLGASLQAFGLPNGNLLAWHLIGGEDTAVDPWPRLDEALKHPERLPKYLRDGIGATLQRKWEQLPKVRRDLLMLLARFNLNNDQAIGWYQQTERDEGGIHLSDQQILENPYLLFEEGRIQPDPVSFDVVDRGLFPPQNLRSEFPITEPSGVHEAVDARRVRAVMIDTLEGAAQEGHTLLPASWLITRVHARSMKPECPLDVDTIAAVGNMFEDRIAAVDLPDGTQAFQLDRLAATSKLIGTVIEKRAAGKRNVGEYDWRLLVDHAVAGEPESDSATGDDEIARTEKACALQEIYESSVSVVVGAAGTGKSTLLKALCSIESVRNGGILLLAPTGKARVRLEQASGMLGHGMTLAQFLLKFQRYDGGTACYYVNSNAARSSAHKTVAIDECSMLTEEQLAALFDAVRGVDRLILVGDPQQLSPIEAGRPYVDIVRHLKPENIESRFPRVGAGYAELTVAMRHQHDRKSRSDLLLANAFSGQAQDAGADEVWYDLLSGGTGHIKVVRWNQPGQLQQSLLNELVAELGLDSSEDEIKFEESVGGTVSGSGDSRYVYFNASYRGGTGAGASAERWQILSPTRQGQAGVLALNRAIQQRFRKNLLELAAQTGYRRKIPYPAGPEGIVYGDKVINVANSSRRKVFPDRESPYVANGDIGVVTGPWRKKGKNIPLTMLNVELASQPGFTYTYWASEFDSQEGTPPLELAYALTIHKTQGSEFEKTFVVIPNPCRMLSREMVYTALTRHRGKIVVFHQGNLLDLLHYTRDETSEVARRLTNLFGGSRPVEVRIKNKSVFLDDNLIYRTDHGELVRSKSEWIIADKLHQAGIDYQYEQPVMLAGVERYPDFTIRDDDSGTTWYWEHNGLMGNARYVERWKRKLDAYRREGIRTLSDGGGENGTLLLTEEQEGVGLDAGQISANIGAILGK